MTICTNCKGSGVIQGAPGNAPIDNFGNKTQSQGDKSNQGISCQQCLGKGYC